MLILFWNVGFLVHQDGSCSLPLPFDDPLQPLYNGPPLPLCVLEAAGISADENGNYKGASPERMAKACRFMAAWKVAGNGENVRYPRRCLLWLLLVFVFLSSLKCLPFQISTFSARGGPAGGKNPRKQFGAELADPYAQPDGKVRPTVDASLRVVCSALLDESESPDSYADLLRRTVPESQTVGVLNSFVYLRDRVGVPRDLPLASARYLRAYLNWGIDCLSQR